MNIEPIDTYESKDFRAGQICSTVANFSTRLMTKPAVSADFFPSLSSRSEPEAPILLANPEEHARLVMAKVFGTTMEQAYGKRK